MLQWISRYLTTNNTLYYEKCLDGHRTKKWDLITTNQNMTPNKHKRERENLSLKKKKKNLSKKKNREKLGCDECHKERGGPWLCRKKTDNDDDAAAITTATTVRLNGWWAITLFLSILFFHPLTSTSSHLICLHILLQPLINCSFTQSKFSFFCWFSEICLNLWRIGTGCVSWDKDGRRRHRRHLYHCFRHGRRCRRSLHVATSFSVIVSGVVIGEHSSPS